MAFERLRRWRQSVFDAVKAIEEFAAASTAKRFRIPLYLWRFCVLVIGRWRLDRCPEKAASLSFQTVLSVVPALAVALATISFTGALEAKSSFVDFLAREYIPLSQEEISVKLLAFSEKIDFASMGIVGFVSTAFIAFVTFNALETSVNHIWRIRKGRSLVKRLATFYVIASVGPLLFGLSLYQAAKFGLTEGWSGVAFSALISFGGLTILNFVLPATKVKLRSAVIGALVATVASELAKLAFAAYVGNIAMDKYSGIYGAMASVPLTLIWIYWSWLTLLLGVEISHLVQITPKRDTSVK